MVAQTSPCPLATISSNTRLLSATSEQYSIGGLHPANLGSLALDCVSDDVLLLRPVVDRNGARGEQFAYPVVPTPVKPLQACVHVCWVTSDFLAGVDDVYAISHFVLHCHRLNDVA